MHLNPREFRELNGVDGVLAAAKQCSEDFISQTAGATDRLDPVVTQPGATYAYDPNKPAHLWAQEVLKLRMENAELRKERAKLSEAYGAVRSDIEDMGKSLTHYRNTLHDMRRERKALQEELTMRPAFAPEQPPADNWDSRIARLEDLVPTFHKTYAVMWGQLRRIVGRSSNERDRALLQLMNDLEGVPDSPEPAKTGRPSGPGYDVE